MRPSSRRRRSWLVPLALAAAACAPDLGPTGPGHVPHTGISPNLATATTAAGVCNYDRSDDALLAQGWSRAFQEEFDGGLGQWTIWNGGAWNEELQHYQPANVAVANGLLTITARRETVTGQTHPWDATPKTFGFTSGRIESRTHFSAGNQTPRVRFAARIRSAAGIGMWPAFWTYGDPWPTQGEIDILEARGNEPDRYHTAYWYGRRSGVNLVRNSEATIFSTESLTDCFHVYEVIWSRTALTYLFDGQVVDVKTGDYISSFYRKHQRVTLNLAVGGLFFGGGLDPATIEPGALKVDWVRVFTAR